MKCTDVFNLAGLRAAPSQVCGGFRLVPLIREKACDDVRISVENYDQNFSRVQLDDKTEYWSFIPHGFVLDWGDQNESHATLGGQLKKHSGKDEQGPQQWRTVRTMKKMVKRRSSHSIRMLPLHTSMEYFLGLCFGGPGIAWPEYSKFVIEHGLGVRYEMAYTGRSLYLFDDAIRTFEINDGQVGVLVYVAEELASAFVVPTHQDYRAVHKTLLEDFYGQLIYQYAVWYPTTTKLQPQFELEGANSIADLRRALHKARQQWSEFSTAVMAEQLVDRQISTDTIYQPGPLTLERFMTDLDLKRVNTIGERLVRADGEVLYLKTFRLEQDQANRGWWLTQLAKYDWHLESVASNLKIGIVDVYRGLDRCGFGYMLNQELLKQARK